MIEKKVSPDEIVPWQYRPDTLCVGLSGSAGIGKTTLMNEANKYLKLPQIEEGVREWMKENKIKDVHALEGKALMKFQMATLTRKIAAESGRKEFISDRTTIDIMAYALYYLSNYPEFQRGLVDYIKDCTYHAAKTYDVIFTLPYGAIPFENDGVRKDLPAHQITIQMLIEHGCGLGAHIFHVHQIQSIALEDRVSEMLDVIDKIKNMKLLATEARKRYEEANEVVREADKLLGKE